MKKFLSILLSATMILSLTACGAKSDDNAKLLLLTSTQSHFCRSFI